MICFSKRCPNCSIGFRPLCLREFFVRLESFDMLTMLDGQRFEFADLVRWRHVPMLRLPRKSAWETVSNSPRRPASAHRMRDGHYRRRLARHLLL